MKTRFLLALVASFGLLAKAAVPLTEGKFTEIIKNVKVVEAATKAELAALTNLVVKAPNMIRTGPHSRAELTAVDQTITRVGANSIFSFDQTGRHVRLEQGSVLFHSPRGKGGGTITSGGASAAVLGTTVICVTMPDGSFKTILVEGSVKVTLTNSGKSITLTNGQMVTVLPGGEGFSEVKDVDLKELTHDILLINGFSNPLDSMGLIIEAIQEQDGKSPGDFANPSEVNAGLDTTDDQIYPPGLLPFPDRAPVSLSPVAPVTGRTAPQGSPSGDGTANPSPVPSPQTPP